MTTIYLKENTLSKDYDGYNVIVQITGNYDIEDIKEHIAGYMDICYNDEGYCNLSMIIDELREKYQVEQVIDMDELEPIYY